MKKCVNILLVVVIVFGMVLGFNAMSSDNRIFLPSKKKGAIEIFAPAKVDGVKTVESKKAKESDACKKKSAQKTFYRAINEAGHVFSKNANKKPGKPRLPSSPIPMPKRPSVK